MLRSKAIIADRFIASATAAPDVSTFRRGSSRTCIVGVRLPLPLSPFIDTQAYATHAAESDFIAALKGGALAAAGKLSISRPAGAIGTIAPPPQSSNPRLPNLMVRSCRIR